MAARMMMAFAAIVAAEGCLITLPEGVDACGEGARACGGRCIDVTNDVKNCGACGHDCGALTCSRGSCEVVSVPNPWGLATYPGDEFIWGTQGAPTASEGVRLFRFRKSCQGACTAERLTVDQVPGFTSSNLRQRTIVVGETFVYWVNQGKQVESDPPGTELNGSVWRLPKNDPSKPCASPARQGRPFGLALAGDGYLYWSNLIGGDDGGQLVRVKKDELCTATPTVIEIGAGRNLGPIAIAPKPGSTVSSGYFVVWGTRDPRGTERGIFRVEPNAPYPSNTVRANVLFTGARPEESVTGLALSGMSIFYRYGFIDLEDGNAALRRAEVDVQGVSSVLTESPEPRQLTVDATHVYFTQGTKPARIVRMPIGGGAVESLALTDTPQGLLLDGPYLYFAEYRNGVIRRVRVKP